MFRNLLGSSREGINVSGDLLFSCAYAQTLFELRRGLTAVVAALDTSATADIWGHLEDRNTGPWVWRKTREVAPYKDLPYKVEVLEALFLKFSERQPCPKVEQLVQALREFMPYFKREDALQAAARQGAVALKCLETMEADFLSHALKSMALPKRAMKPYTDMLDEVYSEQLQEALKDLSASETIEVMKTLAGAIVKGSK